LAQSFFFIFIAAVIILFIISLFFRPIRLEHVIIGITSVAYSLVYENILGEYFRLYHYIDSQVSILYIVLAGVFLYPVLNMLYILFLPSKIKPLLLYTGVWIGAMLFLEYISLLTKTIVFTGWVIFPWSLITYIGTYLWVIFFYSYLQKRLRSNSFH
jgi:hypothetical protein